MAYAWAALAGILLTLTFPEWHLDILAWVALMPLVHGIVTRPRSAFRQGFIAGLFFFWPTLFWLRHVTVAGWLSLGTYLALYPAVWAWTVARFHARIPELRGSHHLLLAGFGAAAWVALEWLRAHLLSGFPWNFMGVSQYHNLALIQIADTTGVYGVSFVLVFFNIAFFTGVRRMVREKFALGKWRYELTVALVLVVVTVVWGMRAFMRMSKETPAAKVRVALIQPNVPQSLKWDEAFELQARKDLKQLTLGAAALQPDLIVWPETALTTGPTYDSRAADFLTDISDQTRLPILVGTIERDPDIVTKYYNSAFLANPPGPSSPYRKRHLVAFGEFVPLEDTFPILRKLTPIGASFSRGEGPQLIELNPGVELGVLICFEDVFPYLARESVGAGANVLVNVTNDGWFKESHQQIQHAANAVFRAVENRVPLVRCCNNGLTCVIEPTGQISASLEEPDQGIYVHGLKSATVGVPAHPRTFYNRYGDVFALTCLAVTALAWIFCVRDSLLSRKAAKAQRNS